MNRDVDRLRDMALFAEVARVGTFIKASETLGVPVSTLSRRVSEFEKGINVKLFHRSTRKTTLTEVGARYYQQIEDILQQVRLVNDELGSETSTPDGQLRVSMPADFGAYLADVHFDELRAAYPSITYEFFLTSAVVDLMVDRYDVSILIGEPPGASRLIARRIGTVHRHLYAAPKYLERHRVPAKPEQLNSHTCLFPPPVESGGGWLMRNGPDVIHVHPDPLLMINSQAVIRQLVIHGMGIGQLSRSYAAALVRTGSLVAVLPEWELDPQALYVLTASRLLPARVRVFVDFLAEKFRGLT